MTEKTIIFHAGSPKTGSTSFQRALEQHEELLKKHRTRYLSRRIFRRNFHPIHEVIRELKRDTLYSKTMSRGREALAKEFETVDTLIISNESALLDGRAKAANPTLYQNIDTKIDRLNELFEGYRVISYLTIRNWRTWFPSYYFQMVRQGESRSFPAYVNSFDPAELDWCRPAEALQHRLNSIADHIVTHETIQKEPLCLLEATLKSADITPPKNYEMPKTNRTYGAGTIHYMRFWNWALNIGKRSPKTRRFIRHNIYPTLTYWLRFTPPLRLKGSLAQAYDTRYKEQVEALQEQDAFQTPSGNQ